MKRVTQTQKPISRKVWKEAKGISDSRMNARHSFAYAFNVNKDNTEIYYGEFMFNANGDGARLKDFDGYIEF